MKDCKLIAVDFDGTLCEDRYPEIGSANLGLIALLRAIQRQGGRLILWTCRSGDRLEEAVEWCGQHGLVFDAVNKNVPETVEKYGTDSRKITADMYIDDRAVNGAYLRDHFEPEYV